MKPFISPILLFISLLFFVSACRPTQEDTSVDFTLTDTMFSRISLDTVQTEQVSLELKFSGKVTPEDNKIASIFPVVAGYITKVNVSLGDYVRKGQILAVIRSTDLADFEKQRRAGETELLLAQKNLKSALELFESRLNTEKDVAAARKTVDDAEAELKRIGEIFNIYGLNNGAFYNIVAPISGFITEKRLNTDMQLPSGFSESVFTIAQIDHVFVTANVYETDIAKVSLNMPAEVVLLSYAGKKFSGKVDQIMNILDPESKTMKIRIRLPNPDYSLKPEMAATVYVRYMENKRLPAVSSEAVVFDRSRNYLMVFHEKDSIETRVVEPLHTTSGKTYISSGLAAGERVIVKNALLVYDALND